MKKTPVGWIAAIALAACAADALPEVPVRVSLCCDPADTEQSFAFLPELPDAERELARAIAGKLAEQVPFFRWSDASATGTTLLVKLVEQPHMPLSIVELHWYRAVNGQQRELALDPILLFTETETERHASDRAAFVEHATAKLAHAMNSAFFERFRKEFAAKVPLATEVEALPAERRVVVLLPFREARLGMESELKVQFLQSPRQGNLALSNLSPRAAQPHANMLQAAVRSAMFDSEVIPLDNGWSDRLPALLEGARIRCFVTSYVAPSDFESGDFVGDLVLEP